MGYRCLHVLSCILTLASAQSSPPNILFILADDLGWNDVSWHNPEVISPNLEKLAREGLILENNYVQPTCSPSRAALLTGYYPIHTGMQFLPIQNTEPIGLPLSFKLLPQYLKDVGYSTHLVGKWHLGYCSREYQPTNRGFDSFMGLWNSGGDHNLHLANALLEGKDPVIGYDFHKDENIYLRAINTDTSEIIGDRISEILSERAGQGHPATGLSQEGYPATGLSQEGYPARGKINMTGYDASRPFYIQANFQDVHAPLQVQAEFEALYPNEEDPSRKTYLGMVSRLDAAVGRIVAELQRFTYFKEGTERTLLQDTVIIFSSDNGGMSQGLGYGGASNYPFQGRKGDLWEGGCRVPGFVYNAGRTGVTDDLFHITDWLPTIYSGLAGGDASNLPGDLDGMNQIDLISNPEGASVRDAVLLDMANFEALNYTFVLPPGWPGNFLLDGSFGAAYRFQDWKIMLGCSTTIGCSRNYNESMGGNTSNDRVMLYNLAEDPSELNDLSEDPEYADIIEELRSRLMVYKKSAREPLHLPLSEAALPSNHFPPGQFFTGWCEPIWTCS